MDSAYRTLLKNPRQSANLISFLFFGWSIPIFKKSYHKVLHPNDTFEPLDEDRSDRLGDRLEKYKVYKRILQLKYITRDIYCRHWEAERIGRSRPSLLRALFKTFWSEVLILGLFCIFTDCICRLTYAFLLDRLLSYFRFVHI